MMDFDQLDEQESLKRELLAQERPEASGCGGPDGAGGTAAAAGVEPAPEAAVAAAAEAVQEAEEAVAAVPEAVTLTPAGADGGVHSQAEESAVEPEPATAAEAVQPLAKVGEMEEPAAGTGQDASAATRAKQGQAPGAKESGPGTAVKPAAAEDDSSIAVKPTGVAKDPDAIVASPSSPLISQQTWERLEKRCGEIPVVKAVAETLSLSPLVVALALSISAVAFLLYGFGGQLLCVLLGFLYPAYESFKAAERCDPPVMQFWLMYWVVWAIFVTAEHFCYYVLIWIPFYYPFKLAALLWLFNPTTRGARFVYRWFIMPVLQRNQERIDAALEQSGDQIKRGVSGALTGAVGVGVNTVLVAGAGAGAPVRRLSVLFMEAVALRRAAAGVEESD